jgi:hypothetical protein
MMWLDISILLENKMTVAYTMTEDSVTVTFLSNGETLTIDSSHENWDEVVSKLKEQDYEGLDALMSVKRAVEQYVGDNEDVVVDNNGVKYKGEYVHNYLTNKIVDFAKKDLPLKPLVAFFEKVMKNPSSRSVEYLYRFLEHKKMPLLDNGNFLAYKSVRPDYTDWHTGRVDNSVGKQVDPMPRNMVDDDPQNGCSRGYHAGSFEYASTFHPGQGHIVIVEVDPENCVMVPHDCGYQKLRCTTYEVVAEYKGVLNDDYDDRRAMYEDEDDDEDEDDSDYEAIEERIEDLKQELTQELISGGSSMWPERARYILDLIDELEKQLND